MSGGSTTRPLQSDKGIWTVHGSLTVEWKKAVEGTGARQRGSREGRVGRGRTLWDLLSIKIGSLCHTLGFIGGSRIGQSYTSHPRLILRYPASDRLSRMTQFALWGGSENFDSRYDKKKFSIVKREKERKKNYKRKKRNWIKNCWLRVVSRYDNASLRYIPMFLWYYTRTVNETLGSMTSRRFLR